MIFEPSYLIRIFAIIYAVLAIFAAIMLWLNSAAQDALTNTGIVVAGLIPVFIAILPYLKTQEKQKEYIISLFFDENKKQLIQGNINKDFFSPYLNAYFPFYSNLQKDALKQETTENLGVHGDTLVEHWHEFYKNKGLDFVERGILMKLIQSFMSHWDFETSKNSLPSGSIISKKLENKEVKKITSKELGDIFSHNNLLKNNWLDISPPYLNIPPDTSITAFKKGNTQFEKRVILFKNNYVKPLKIEIQGKVAGVLQGGVWGFLPPSEHLRHLGYSVSLYVKFNRWRNHSPEIQAYRNWFNNINYSLEELNWSTIDQEIEKSHMRTMISRFSP